MEKFNFEDYRQPWETGPHWELKQEFLEKYQDVFPIDRLLCLAQAYSNIELLQCSYPAPVMHQIHELSKSLKGCKSFKRPECSNDGNGESSQSNKGKRNIAEDVSVKKFKFIKFCTSEESTETNTKDTHKDSSQKSDELFENDCFKKTKKVNINENVEKVTNDCNILPNQQFIKEKISNSTENIDQNSSIPDRISVDYSSIAQSPDFKIIEKLAFQVQKLLLLRKEKPMDAIQSAALILRIKHIIHFKSIRNLNAAFHKCFCEFYVGTTRLSLGDGNDEVSAKNKAAEYALNMLMNFQDLPTKSLDDVQINFQNEKAQHEISILTAPSKNSQTNIDSFSNKKVENIAESQNDNIDLTYTQSENDRLFLEKFANNLKVRMRHNRHAALSVINETATHLKQLDSLIFNISEDLSTPPHNRLFICNLTLKNILISKGEANSKKKAKVEAAEKGIKFLIDLLESKRKNIPQYADTIHNKDSSRSDKKKKDSFSINFNALGSQTNVTTSVIEMNSQDFSHSKISSKKSISNKTEFHNYSNLNENNTFDKNISKKTTQSKNFILNNRLFNNSIQKSFVLFDRSSISDPSLNKPRSILTYSTQQCHKGTLTYNVEDSCNGTYIATALLDKQIIGSGIGANKDAAKDEAAISAIKKLQKEVYTIKVKHLEEDCYIINRNEVLEFSSEISNAVSDDNIGCKMLKMMGWSGGGMGKMEKGIIEPVTVKDHSLRTGLGYGEDINSKISEPKFNLKIENILREFSRSNSTGALVFSPEFTKNERQKIHKIATKFKISHNSVGKHHDRQLCLRRKITVPELLNTLLKEGGCTNKYELIDMSS